MQLQALRLFFIFFIFFVSSQVPADPFWRPNEACCYGKCLIFHPRTLLVNWIHFISQFRGQNTHCCNGLVAKSCLVWSKKEKKKENLARQKQFSYLWCYLYCQFAYHSLLLFFFFFFTWPL